MKLMGDQRLPPNSGICFRWKIVGRVRRGPEEGGSTCSQTSKLASCPPCGPALGSPSLYICPQGGQAKKG